jgi:uncharacterized protein (TIGR03435 family)
MTGLTANYDLDLEYSMDELRTMLRARAVSREIPRSAGEDPGTSLFDLVKKYGLRLEARKAPLEVVVVDRVEKSPSGN